MSVVGIVAALPGELKPLVRAWPRTDTISVGFLGGVQCYAACAGMGEFAAAKAFARLREASGGLDAVVSYGWAGALSCGISASRVYPVAEVIDSRTGERYTTQHGSRGMAAPLRLVTLDHVARPEEKRPLAERYKAVLVDMEAATVARLARAHDLPFLCLKGVSDGYTDQLPDFNRFLGRDGQLRKAPLLGHALLRPGALAALLKLGRQSREAAHELARALPELLGVRELVS